MQTYKKKFELELHIYREVFYTGCSVKIQSLVHKIHVISSSVAKVAATDQKEILTDAEIDQQLIDDLAYNGLSLFSLQLPR